MSFKKLIISISTLAVASSSAGLYFVSKSEKLEIKKQETKEEKKSKIIAQNKKILDDLLAGCKKGIMKSKSTWDSLYNPSSGAESEINFECKSKKIKMKISKNQDNDYTKITDTTKNWWPEKEKRFIVFEISPKNKD